MQETVLLAVVCCGIRDELRCTRLGSPERDASAAGETVKATGGKRNRTPVGGDRWSGRPCIKTGCRSGPAMHEEQPIIRRCLVCNRVVVNGGKR